MPGLPPLELLLPPELLLELLLDAPPELLLDAPPELLEVLPELPLLERPPELLVEPLPDALPELLVELAPELAAPDVLPELVLEALPELPLDAVPELAPFDVPPELVDVPLPLLLDVDDPEPEPPSVAVSPEPEFVVPHPVVNAAAMAKAAPAVRYARTWPIICVLRDGVGPAIPTIAIHGSTIDGVYHALCAKAILVRASPWCNEMLSVSLTNTESSEMYEYPIEGRWERC